MFLRKAITLAAIRSRRNASKAFARPLPRWILWFVFFLVGLTTCFHFREMDWILVSQYEVSAERIKKGGVACAFENSLRDYIHFHSEQRKLPSVQRRNVLRWSFNNYDGLGDRVRGVLHAFILSVETRRYFELGSSRGFGSVAYPAAVLWNKTYTGKIRRIKAWNRWDAPELAEARKFLWWYGRRQALHLISRNVAHYERLVSSDWYTSNCVQVGWPAYSQRERCWYDGTQNMGVLRLAHRALFRYRPHVLKRVDALMERDNLTANRYIVIHGRVGYTKERHYPRFRPYHGKRRDASIRKLLACAIHGTGDAIGQVDSIYLASDDREFKKRMAELVMEFRQLAHLRIVNSAVEAKHTGIRSGRKSAARKSLEDAVAESILMGKSRILVNTGSGLSVYAAITGNAQLLTPKHCELLAK